MVPKTTSIIVATFLVGSIASMTPLIQTSAESYCLVGFNLVTNAEAATVDPEVPEIDANGDGLLCRTDMTSGVLPGHWELIQTATAMGLSA
ncbi:MAG: hypothetical protein AUJ08_04860 [Thaumarchaeota archaeon 13_1_40CM_3_50_5]|nr:MAG: hypothetical protein AUJ08_04860 [Thaumarchaeota archaeon 13_1_40CM_3_50_5]